MHRTTLLGAIATVAVTALGLLAGSAATAGPDSRATTFTKPTVPGWPISNPGVIHTHDSHGSRYVVLETGGATQLGTIAVATDPDSRASWTRLSDRRPLDPVPGDAPAGKGGGGPPPPPVPPPHPP